MPIFLSLSYYQLLYPYILVNFHNQCFLFFVIIPTSSEVYVLFCLLLWLFLYTDFYIDCLTCFRITTSLEVKIKVIYMIFLSTYNSWVLSPSVLVMVTKCFHLKRRIIYVLSCFQIHDGNRASHDISHQEPTKLQKQSSHFYTQNFLLPQKLI